MTVSPQAIHDRRRSHAAFLRWQNSVHPENRRAREHVDYLVTKGELQPPWELLCTDCQLAEAEEYYFGPEYNLHHQGRVVPLCFECYVERGREDHGREDHGGSS